MKSWFVALLFLILIPQYVFAGTTLAWFTDATIENSTKLSAPSGAPPLVSGGTYNNCLDLTQSVALSNVTLSSVNGTIGFWLRPKWNGASGSNHKILRVGNPSTTNDGLLIEINKDGIFRYVMAGGGKVTVARTDVSSWKSGEWHHVQIGWLEKDGNLTGLAIWIDRVAVSSVVFGGTRYMNQATMQDKNVYIGDASSEAFMDELIFRDNLTVYSEYSATGGLPIAYRDYFRTAPYTAIQITHKAQLVNSDQRVISGFKKQFAVVATKLINPDNDTKVTEYISCFDGPSGSWDDMDARQYITWTSGSNSKATVDTNGLVTGVATTTSPITITARFRGMTAAYSLDVISSNQPDLDLMYVERTPKYALRTSKIWPDTGEEVTSIVHYGNFGYQTCNSFKIKFELIRDNNLNFVLDASDTPVGPPVIQEITTPLAPGDKTGTASFKWRWPAGNANDPPVFVRVTLDPDNAVQELCEANNTRCDLNTGRLVHWGYGRDASGRGDNDNNFVNDYNNKVINLVGSFSDYDWCQANVDRLNIVLREAVWPTTSPVGIRDSARVDMFHTLDEYLEDHNNPNGLYQGGYEEMWDTRMTLSPGNIHEMGHTCLGLPDMYGQGLATCNMFLKDEQGNPYGGTPLYPTVAVGDEVGPWTAATWGYPDALGVGYTPLMVNNHQWLDVHCAGWVDKYAKQRLGIPDTFGVMVPSETKLQLFDVNDNPLTNARIYVYQCINTGCIYMPNKYYPDRPKFIFTDGGTGIYTIPKTTSQYWDDWDTDIVERAVSAPTPFDRSNGQKAWGPSWQVGEMLLLKIVGADGKVEFQTLPLTEFNVAYLSGNTSTWTRPVRTSLTSPATPPDILVPFVPAGDYNYKPVPLIKYNGVTYSSNLVVTVPYSETQDTNITLDGSPSHDYGNEGQPLQYRWSIFSGSLNAVHNFTIPAGTAPGDYDFRFYVIDGLRFSIFDGGVIRIVMPAAKITGHVTDQNGQPLANAIVGIKTSPYATADAAYYLTTNFDGDFTSVSLPPLSSPEQYYVAAWKDGYAPTKDTAVSLQGTDVSISLQLTELSGTRVNITSQQISASSCAVGSSVANAIDGNLSTGWLTTNWPATPVYYYIDLRDFTDICWLSLYRYQSGNYMRDDYTIDTMSSGDPLTPSSWVNNSSVKTVYSANATYHGYKIGADYAVDPIRLDLVSIKGIRLGFKNAISQSNYQMREMAFWTNNPPVKVSALKALAIGSTCKTNYKQVTSISGGGIPTYTCYIEEQDRSSGLRINLMSVSQTKVNIGDYISVSGTLRSAPTGELFIGASTIQVAPSTSTPTIKPIGMNNISFLNGKKLACGLLTRVWGRVDTVSTTYFMLSTGANAKIKVTCGTATKPAQGKFVSVNGILSTDGTNSVLLMKSNSDWSEITQ